MSSVLRRAGLTPRALAAWSGVDRLSALPARLARLPAPTRAAAALELFVRGTPVPRAWLADEVVALADLDGTPLVELDTTRATARLAILPVRSGFVVCDRLDLLAFDDFDKGEVGPGGENLACWPDDSSYHLVTAIPAGRRMRWIDLGCGSAFAQLARPELADERIGVDVNRRIVEFAKLGAALSNVAIALRAGDVACSLPRADLVTCNAPIPDAGAIAWRSTDDDFFARLWATVPDRLLPDGLAVVHCARSAIPDALPGERLVCTYTPPGFAPAFSILWWRPDAASARVEMHRELAPARPHVDADDRAVLASRVCRP